MTGTAGGTVLVVAVVAIAVAQIGLVIVALVVGRRLLAQLVPLLAALTEATAHLQEATDRFGALAEQANETIGAGHHALAQVGAFVGAGRSLIERAVGAALLRRLLPAGLGGVAAAAGGAGTVAAVKTGIDLAIGAWRAVAAHRARRRAEGGPPTGTRAGAAALAQTAATAGAAAVRPRLRAGNVRRLPEQGDLDAPSAAP